MSKSIICFFDTWIGRELRIEGSKEVKKERNNLGLKIQSEFNALTRLRRMVEVSLHRTRMCLDKFGRASSNRHELFLVETRRQDIPLPPTSRYGHLVSQAV